MACEGRCGLAWGSWSLAAVQLRHVERSEHLGPVERGKRQNGGAILPQGLRLQAKLLVGSPERVRGPVAPGA